MYKFYWNQCYFTLGFRIPIFLCFFSLFFSLQFFFSGCERSKHCTLGCIPKMNLAVYNVLAVELNWIGVLKYGMMWSMEHRKTCSWTILQWQWVKSKRKYADWIRCFWQIEQIRSNDKNGMQNEREREFREEKVEILQMRHKPAINTIEIAACAMGSTEAWMHRHKMP